MLQHRTKKKAYAWSALLALACTLLAPASAWADGMAPLPVQGITLAQEPTSTPALGANVDRFTISGLSSGAYMAVQIHVAHSTRVEGAAIFAGGPYGCARVPNGTALLSQATQHCVHIKELDGNPSYAFRAAPTREQVRTLVDWAKELSDSKAIDPLGQLESSRVYLFSGTQDTVVYPEISRTLGAWYQAFMPPSRIQENFATPAAHAILTPHSDRPCDTTGSPFMVNCGIDGVGQALNSIAGPLTPPPSTASGPLGTLYTIDQKAHIPSDRRPWFDWIAALGWGYTGLADQAFIFVPTQCDPSAPSRSKTAATSCRVHVAFHGCKQGAAFLGTRFAQEAGYNRWAAANDMIVLYPQISPMTSQTSGLFGTFNPNGCWDWWGYTGDDYLTQSAVQIRTVLAMVDALGVSP